MRKSKRIITKLVVMTLIAGGLCLSPNSNATTVEECNLLTAICFDGCLNNYLDATPRELIGCMQVCEELHITYCYH